MTKINNKVALVSGGSDGVGLSVVKALFEEGYDVYFIGANLDKGLAIENNLKENKVAGFHSVIKFIHLDLSDLVAVKNFTCNFISKVSHLDRLFLSAGVLLPWRTESKQGIEKTFSIGYLSAYLLSHELLPLLEKAEQARVLTVSGGAGIVLKANLNFDDFNYQGFYIGFNAAARTVHAKAVLSQILAQQWANKGIMSNTLHPGLVKSSLGRSLPWPLNIGMKLVAQFMANESKTAICACLSEEFVGVTGQHIDKQKQRPLPFESAYQAQLIEKTKSLLSTINFDEELSCQSIP